MASYEQQLQEKYLTNLYMLGEEGSYPNVEIGYQEIRHARGANAPRTLEEAAELRFKDLLDAARLFNQFRRDQATDKSPCRPG